MYMNMQDWSILRDLQWFGCYQISNYSVYEKKKDQLFIFGRVNLYIIVIDFIDYFMRRCFFYLIEKRS